MMSSKNGGFQIPPPSLVSQNQKLAYPAAAPKTETRTKESESSLYIRLSGGGSLFLWSPVLKGDGHWPATLRSIQDSFLDKI